MKTDDIVTVIREFCKHGARAVSRYVEVSDLDPEAMPEYFMPAFIFDHMGNDVSMTLETNFLTLLEFNMHAKGGHRESPAMEDIRALAIAADLGKPRVDLVIYADPHLPKNKQPFLALVEFKKGWISAGEGGDRDKLQRVLKHIDICKYGVVCGWAATPEEARDEARKVGDLWFEEPFEMGDRKCFFCARVFQAN
jgi:hypothetical protein